MSNANFADVNGQHIFTACMAPASRSFFFNPLVVEGLEDQPVRRRWQTRSDRQLIIGPNRNTPRPYKSCRL
jgi:hypothetical protein